MWMLQNESLPPVRHKLYTVDSSAIQNNKKKHKLKEKERMSLKKMDFIN